MVYVVFSTKSNEKIVLCFGLFFFGGVGDGVLFVWFFNTLFFIKKLLMKF